MAIQFCPSVNCVGWCCCFFIFYSHILQRRGYVVFYGKQKSKEIGFVFSPLQLLLPVNSAQVFALEFLSIGIYKITPFCFGVYWQNITSLLLSYKYLMQQECIFNMAWREDLETFHLDLSIVRLDQKTVNRICFCYSALFFTFTCF